jgi:hypothetical protein
MMGESPAPTTTSEIPTDRSPEPVVVAPLPTIITSAKISPHIQGTEEWHRERLGKLSASRMHRVINGTMKGWQSLMAELREEIRHPDAVLAEEPMYSEDTEHGKAYEDVARAEAELELGMDIVCVGYATHHQHQWLGASVDGLILNEDGSIYATVEIKCFTNLTNHAYVWTNKRVLDKYIPQVQTQNLVYEAPRSLFVSYHDQMPDPKARVAIVEMPPDKPYQSALLARAHKFNLDFEAYQRNGGNLPIQTTEIPKRF